MQHSKPTILTPWLKFGIISYKNSNSNELQIGQDPFEAPKRKMCLKSVTVNIFATINLIFCMFCVSPNFVRPCHLVPFGGGGPGSCMDLKSTPGITWVTSPFGRYIEGTSTNRKGEMFAVNYGNSTTLNTMGQFYPTIRPIYADPWTSSRLHGMRFLNSSLAYAVDLINHRVLQLRMGENYEGFQEVVGSSTFCGDPSMIEPNDLTLSRSGTVFTSGMTEDVPNTGDRDGQIWSCNQNGEMKLLEVMGRTNGIDLSPDDRLLYVSESYTASWTAYVQRIWVYDVNGEIGTISGKRLFADFQYIDSSQSIDIDGMRTDVNGNLWVARYGGGQVMVFNQFGQVIGRVWVSFRNVTNLEFGGDQGKTLFIVGKCDEAEAGCIDSIQVVTPGRQWCSLQEVP